MSEETPADAEEEIVEEVVEEIDPLAQALGRAETAEKEISYRDAEIQNVRKRNQRKIKNCIILQIFQT